MYVKSHLLVDAIDRGGGGGGPGEMDGDVIAFLLVPADDKARPSVICGKVRLAFAADGAIDGRSNTLNCIPPGYNILFHTKHIIHIHNDN